MPLNTKDISEMYQLLYRELRYPMQIESVSIWEMILNSNYDPEKIKGNLEKEIEVLKKKLAPHDGWCDVRDEKNLLVRKALLKVLFCPLEEVPLCINEQFVEIAKWRLENAK